MRERSLLFALFTVAFCATAEARIGETLERCKKRYGAPVESRIQHYEWDIDGITVTCILSDKDFRGTTVEADKECIRIEYEAKRGLSADDVKQILAKNGGKSEWVPLFLKGTGRFVFATKDGGLMAEMEADGTVDSDRTKLIIQKAPDRLKDQGLKAATKKARNLDRF